MFPIDSPSMCQTPALKNEDSPHLELHLHHHEVPEIHLPPEASNQTGWINLLAAAGLPRVGSLGFSDNYLNDAMPPATYNFDENSQSSVTDGLRMKLVGPTEIEIPTEVDPKKKFWGIWGRPQRGVTAADLVSKSGEILPKEDLERLKKEILQTDYVDLVQGDVGASAASTTTVSTDAHLDDDEKAPTTNDPDIFQFDDDSSAATTASKPVGRLTKLIMNQPFAKNWFFRARDSESGSNGTENFGPDRLIQFGPKRTRELAFMTPQTY